VVNFFLPYEGLQQLIDLLIASHYTCIGPQISDDAIIYQSLSNIKQLPWGLRDNQAPGSYRLEAHDKNQAFAWANGPQAVKPNLFSPKETLFSVKRDENGKLIFKEKIKSSKKALIGVRPCDLHALKIQDKVFIQSDFVDPYYQKKREQVFLIIVNCSYSSSNCFCLTAGGHPQAKSGFDVSLTEIKYGFVAQFSSRKARELLKKLHLKKVSESQENEAQSKIASAVKGQTKTLPLQEDCKKLVNHSTSPQWDDVAKRCLSCGNCTQVCPTCFCHSEFDEVDIKNNDVEHVRQWDSCFTSNHSYIHGMIVRKSTKERYRQWLTHKFATWHDQFGTSGCVGCGRCVTWCPTGIDVTEEIKAIVKDEDSA
jgi:ferredoxin